MKNNALLNKRAMLCEIRTLLSQKSLYICVALMIAVISVLVYNSYSMAESQILFSEESISYLNECAETDGVIVDTSSDREDILTYLTALSPSLDVNNSFLFILSMGAMFMPLAAVLFMGGDYSSKAIKTKAVKYGLFRTYMCKIICFSLLIIAAVILSLIAGMIMSRIGWNNVLSAYAEKYDFTPRAANVNYAFVAVVLGMMIFYSVLCMLVTALFKSRIVGLLAVVIINFWSIDISFTPHHLFQKLNVSFFCNQPASPVAIFLSDKIIYPSVPICALLLVAYFAAFIGGLLLLGKWQKN
ncbi:MAG: hypothetical protein IJC18_00885 [Clostridia bacterium]|nr:hypothetical protein [Clostridia bacterium]